MSQETQTKTAKTVPSYTGTLRSHSLSLPHCVSECSGIRIFGKRIKSIAFSTDVAIIKNINADAVIAVYPFTPQPSISQAIISVSDVPVFVGVGGGRTGGRRSVELAMQALQQANETLQTRFAPQLSQLAGEFLQSSPAVTMKKCCSTSRCSCTPDRPAA